MNSNKIALVATTILAGVGLLITKTLPIGHFVIFGAIVLIGLELSDNIKNLKP